MPSSPESLDINILIDQILNLATGQTLTPESIDAVLSIADDYRSSGHPDNVTCTRDELEQALSAHCPSASPQAQTGRDALYQAFGIGRPSWLILPRVLMHEMPDNWQSTMARLMQEFDEEFKALKAPDLHVSAREGNKYVTLPSWLCNYRYPEMDKINEARGVT